MKKIVISTTLAFLFAFVVGCAADNDNPPDFIDGGIALMLDDFEDGDDAIMQYSPEDNTNCAVGTPLVGNCTGSPIDGDWYYFDDETAGDSNITDALTLGVNNGSIVGSVPGDGANNTIRAAHFTGSGFTEWGAGIGFDLNFWPCDPDDGDGGADDGGVRDGKQEVDPKCPVDLSMYKGIRFFAKGSGIFDFSIQQMNTINVEEGGTCVEGPDVDETLAYCSNGYGRYAVALESEWQLYTLDFTDDLANPNRIYQDEGWGQIVPIDMTTAVQVLFQAKEAALNPTFELYLDEVHLYSE